MASTCFSGGISFALELGISDALGFMGDSKRAQRVLSVCNNDWRDGKFSSFI